MTKDQQQVRWNLDACLWLRRLAHGSLRDGNTGEFKHRINEAKMRWNWLARRYRREFGEDAA